MEAWLISQTRGDKRNRGSGSTISEDNPIARQLDEGTSWLKLQISIGMNGRKDSSFSGRGSYSFKVNGGPQTNVNDQRTIGKILES